MRISLYVVCAAVFLTSGAVAADEDTVAADKDTQESKPIELSAAQMDQITAGTLQLNNNNNKEIFVDFDNPAPNVNGYFGLCDTESGAFCHPALTRRSNQVFAAAADGHDPTVAGAIDGPWAATAASGVISCVGANIPAGAGPNGTGSGCSP